MKTLSVKSVLEQLASAARGCVQRVVRRIRCEHEWKHKRNIYGDEILVANARSVWVCAKCGKFQWRKELYYAPNSSSNDSKP